MRYFKLTDNCTPRLGTEADIMALHDNNPLSPSRSVDSCLPKTPTSSNWRNGGSAIGGSGTPTRGGIFSSLERGLDKMRAALVTGMTPRRRTAQDGPRRVRALHNVTVSTSTACGGGNGYFDDVLATGEQDHVREALDRLQSALTSRGISFKSKGDFLLRCSVCDDWGKAHLVFDLEVCRLTTEGANLGVRRKRVKGDTWYYKRLCEDVIRAAQL